MIFFDQKFRNVSHSQSRRAFGGVVFCEIVTHDLGHVLCYGIIDVWIEIVCHIFD